MPMVFFTIVANNYLAYAETLMESLAVHHAESPRFIILCDEPSPVVWRSCFAEIVPVRDLGLADFANMALHYDVMEFSTAIKAPSFFWLLERFPGQNIVYLDPDILVTAPLVHVEAALDQGASIVLTPHITSPLQDGFMPDDLTIMKSGIYNLGFVAFSATPESFAFLGWWRDRCRRDAIVDIADNKFTDQRWIDMAPALIRRTHILHHSGYNLAYWNLSHRTVTSAGDQTLVDGEELRFVHFSGVNAADPAHFSKHQNRFSGADLGDLRRVLDFYIGRLLANGWLESRKTAYAYASFSGGRKVHPMMRLSFRRHRDSRSGDSLDGDGAIFDRSEPGLAALGRPAISSVLYELWHSRSDLTRAFDVQAPDGRESYLRWCVNGGGVEARLDARSIAAVQAMLSDTAAPQTLRKPWPDQRTALFAGSRAAVDTWLAQLVPLRIVSDDGGVPIPRQLALLWETRADLSAHFRCQTSADLRDLLTWAITDGVVERCVDLDLIAPTLAPYLAAAEDEGSETMPPLTRLMRLCASRYGGPFADLVAEQGGTALGRIALGLWIIGPAARTYGWPASFTSKIRQWFSRRAGPYQRVGMPFSNLEYSLWRLRADLRATMEVTTAGGQLLFLSWVLTDGLREMRLSWEDLSSELRDIMGGQIGPAHPGLLCLHFMIWSARLDLQDRFQLGSPSQIRDMAAYLSAEQDDEWSAGSLLTKQASWTTHPPSDRPAPTAPKAQTPACVLLTGLVTSASGRGEDVRMTEASLRAAGQASTYLDRGSERYIRPHPAADEAETAPFAVNIVHLNAETSLSDYSFLRRARAAGAYTIGYWAWELSAFPAVWNQAFAIYDEIWASTRFAHSSIAGSSNRPVLLMPMAVELPDVDVRLSRADFGLREDAFVFYYGFDLRSFISRKNPEATIAAFRAAFPEGTEKVSLLVKTLGGDAKPDDLAALRLQVLSDPRIIVQDVEYTAIQVATLIDRCDCFVSLHRSEGFGRGPAEAMLLGKPVIATNYSGNIDFMNARNSLLVDFKLIPLVAGDYPGWEGQEWADPDIDHAARHMRRIATDPALARRLGRSASAYMRKHHSAQAVGLKMAKRLHRLAAQRASAGRG